MTQETFINSELNVYFVVSNDYENENRCNEDMWHAYNQCVDHSVQVEWIAEIDCYKLNPTKTDVFVFETFEGDLFEKLKLSKCSLVSAKCLLICFINADPIPEGPSPIFTTAMRNLVITASGIPETSKKIVQEKIEYMGGIYTKQLRSSVTHLITNSIISKKYQNATGLGASLRTVEWINDVWEKNLEEFIPATHSVFDKFICPVFLNLIVTTSNISNQKKGEIKHLIESNGGKFMGALDGTQTHVVFAPDNSASSPKLKFAMKNDIPCLKIEWIYESIKKGYAVSHEEFIIRIKNETSTPENSRVHASFDISSVSAIAGFETNQKHYFEETAATTMSFCSSGNQLSQRPPRQFPSMIQTKIADSFLDGCNVYLAGFSPQERSRMNKILNIGSATRVNDISQAITHFLIGDLNKASNELKLLRTKGLRPHILKIEWLEESIKLKKPAPEELFIYSDTEEIDQEPSESASPLSKKNLRMLQQSKTLTRTISSSDSAIQSFQTEPSDYIIQQYQQREDTDASEPTMMKNRRTTLNVSAIPSSQEIGVNGLFRGLTFTLSIYPEEELNTLNCNILIMGGKIVPHNYSGVVDFAIVPFFGSPLKIPVKEIVTEYFVNDCIEKNELVEIMYYHRPIGSTGFSNPLSNCVITLSIYSGVERKFLADLIEALGARCQNIFSRKNNVGKGVYASTHLICPKPEGNKYKGALNWNLPVVKADWLIACSKTNAWVDETPYMIGDASTNLHQTNQTVLLNNQDTLTTPSLVNKRLDTVKNCTSRSEVATPESPLGAIFGPDPSPDTRKKWKKWIDNIPILKPTPPILRKQTPKTPLSALIKDYYAQWGTEPNENSIVSEENNEKTDKSSVNIYRRLEFDENSPCGRIPEQIADLASALQRNSAHITRSSSIKQYVETSDDILSGGGKESQADTVGWLENPERRGSTRKSRIEENLTIELNNSSDESSQDELKKKFMLSGFKDKTEVANIIRDLEGEISTETNFDSTATHLICERLSRNEKILGSIAAGKWVLHVSYLQNSEEEAEFLDEEDYEWGNPKSEGNIPVPTGNVENVIAKAAYRWRNRLKLENSTGAFENMVAILLVQSEKYDQFKRLIEAGMGTVVKADSLNGARSSEKNITHCFIANQPNQSIDWARLASQGILCFPPQYLSDFLINEFIPEPMECIIPEFKKYLPLIPK